MSKKGPWKIKNKVKVKIKEKGAYKTQNEGNWGIK